MRKSLAFCFLALVLLLSACDAVRWVGGRPTSRELSRMRESLQREKEAAEALRAQMQADSLERVRVQRQRDSLALAEDNAFLSDSLSRRRGILIRPARFGGSLNPEPLDPYYIVVGSFRSRENAQTLLNQCGEAGYSGTLIAFRNQYHAVGLCPSASLRETLSRLERMQKEKFCPADAWILVNNE